MASSKINTFRGSDVQEFLNLNSRLKIKDFVNALIGIMKTESIPERFIVIMEKSIYNCVHSYIQKYRHISTDLCRQEFRDASKRHQRNLNSILTYIVQSLKNDRYDTHIDMLNGTIIVKVDSITVLKEEVTPRSFSSWYNALKILHHVGAGLTIDNTIVICRILTSVYNIVNEPELFESEKDRMVKELVGTISGTEQYSSINDFKIMNRSSDPLIHEGINDLIETVNTLKYYTANVNRTPPKWASDIVRSLRALHRDERLFIYDNTKPMLSSNSTCSSMKYKGKRITIPGLFASTVEKDYFKELYPDSNLDNIIHFKQEYNINNDLTSELNVISKRRTSIAIKQKKPKPRIIHPLNNSEQDRLSYFHNLLARVLSRIPSDCTFDQAKGPRRLKDVMEKKQGWSIYSLDLSSATDTFSLGLQWLIIKELIFNNKEYASEVSDTWLDLMTSKTSIKVGQNEIEFSFSNGQPQGFLSSFPSFALEHHICMLTVLRKFDPDMNPSDFYNVLGDDGAITARDVHCIIPSMYKQIVNSANVECNLKKGYLYNPDIPEMSVKIAEFARYLILDGIELTPIPTKLLVTEEKFNNYIGLAAWYSDHRKEQWTVEELKYFLLVMNDSDSKHYSAIIDTMVQLNIPCILTQSFKKKFSRLLEGNNADDISIAQALLTHTLLYAAVNRLIGNLNEPISISSLIHLGKELKPFIEKIDDPSVISPYNKLRTVKDEVYNAFNTLSEVCRNYSSLSDVDDEVILIACMLMQTNNSDLIKDKINKVFEGIELLTVNPYTDIDPRKYDDFMNRILELFKNFNMSIERSWSSYSRKIPVDYLNRALVSVNDMLVNKQSITLVEFISNNKLEIFPMPVVDTDESVNSDDFDIEIGGFKEYSDEDWELVL